MNTRLNADIFVSNARDRRRTRRRTRRRRTRRLANIIRRQCPCSHRILPA